MTRHDPEELARKQVELKAFSAENSVPRVETYPDKCGDDDDEFDEDWDDPSSDHYAPSSALRWNFDMTEAPERTSILLYVPWPNGADFRGEGYHDDREGGWCWAGGRAIDRPVVAWMHIPAAPERSA